MIDECRQGRSCWTRLAESTKVAGHLHTTADGSHGSQAPPEAGARRSPGRVVTGVLGAFLLWTGLAGVFATQLYFAGLSWSQALSWTLPRWYSWGLATPIIFWLDRWLAARTALPVRVALHVPLAVVWSTLTILLRLAVRPLRGSPLPPNFVEYFLDRFYSDLLIYAVIAGISFSRLYAAQVRQSAREAHEMALRTADLERRLVESQLQSLRAQLHPHFLFNALNTISAFTETNPQIARRLMAQLGDLLRASLRHTTQPLVTLGEELTFLDDFLAIESARFEGRIHVSVRADEKLLQVPVPGFLLQPLVENAIRHGVGRRLSGGRVEVNVTGTPSSLSIRVRDDGVGLPADWTFERGAGVGLRNVAARLAHLYGRPNLLTLVPIASGGVEVRIDLPGLPRE
jgi:two-component system, LytTR family, sensor kinase